MDTPETAENSNANNKILWHPAFFEAIQLELDEYRHSLHFVYEYQLTTAPLRIDVVIIKKTADIVIKKNIAAIFRKVNLLEYKSPDDNISVKDFYRVYGYACLYLTLNNDVDISDLTLTFVESRKPRELIKHLTKSRNFTIEETMPGIYSVRGDIIPIQIIDSRRLSADENIWLKDLNNRLGAQQLQRLTKAIAQLAEPERIQAYFDVIIRANWEHLQEALNMSNTAPTMDEILEKVGFTARWEARGRVEGEARGEARGKEEIVRNMLNRGFPLEQIAELSGLGVEKIKTLRWEHRRTTR